MGEEKLTLGPGHRPDLAATSSRKRRASSASSAAYRDIERRQLAWRSPRCRATRRRFSIAELSGRRVARKRRALGPRSGGHGIRATASSGPRACSSGPSISSSRTVRSRAWCGRRCAGWRARLGISDAAAQHRACLITGKVALAEADGVLPDGTPFAIPEQGGPSRAARGRPRRRARASSISPCRTAARGDPRSTRGRRRQPAPAARRMSLEITRYRSPAEAPARRSRSPGSSSG